MREKIDREANVLIFLNKELKKLHFEKEEKEKQRKKKRELCLRKNKKDFIEECSLNKEEKLFLERWKHGDITKYTLEDYHFYIHTLPFYLKESVLDDTYIQNIASFVDFLCTLEEEKKITRENVEQELYQIIDSLNHKIREVNKEDKEVRNSYKQIRKKSEIVLEIYKKDTSKEKHDYYYDILEILLTSPKNYYVIEKLLFTRKEFVNAKKRVQIKGETIYIPILYTIIDLYIRNYKLELRNQTKDFVPRDYYLKLYYLFLKNPFLEVDKQQVKKMLSDFIESIDNVNYLKTNKDSILKEVNAMLEGKEEEEEIFLTETVKEHVCYIEYKMIDASKSKRERMDQDYLKEMNSYYEKIKENFENPTMEELKQIQRTLEISNRTKRNIMMGCETISFASSHSYTLSYYDDGSYSFRFNELDLHSFIESTPLEEYLSKALDKGNNLLKKDSRLELSEKKVFPTLTYEVRIEPNGVVGPLKIYPSVTEVEKKYDSIEDKTDEKLKRFLSLYKLLTDDHKSNLDKNIVDNFFLSFFGKILMEYANRNEIPLIVKGNSNFDEDYYMQLHYELCEIYSKIDKNHFKQIFEILNTNLDKEHFVNHDYENGSYHIHLDNDYVKFWNQKVIKESIFQDELDETLILESNEILEKANKGISYVGEKKTIDKKRKKVYDKK